MCKSRAEGGRRCAAHTRPAFHAAIDTVNTASTRTIQLRAMSNGLIDVAYHASSRTGGTEVEALIQHCETSGDIVLADYLRTAQRVAVGMNQGFAQTRAELAAEPATPKTKTLPDDAFRTEDWDFLPDPTTPTQPDPWDPGTPNLEAGEHWSIAEGGTRWHEGGCGAFAIALQERWPHLKIACEMYEDHGAESVAHAWAYDPETGHRFDIFGAQRWEPTTRPDYAPDSHRVLLNQTPEDVRRLFRDWNTHEDAVFDASYVVAEMFDPDYVADDDFDRNHLYFW